MTETPPQPNIAINRSGVGDVDMYTGLTLNAMNTLARAAATFEAQWRAVHTAIKEQEAALDGGAVLGNIVSAAFAKNYSAVEPGVTQGANSVGPALDGTGRAGRGHVVTYMEMDGHEVPAILRAASQDLSV